MELERMKSLWDEMSAALAKQKKSTDTLIIKMTQVNYKNRLNKIFIPEAISSVICVVMDVFIVANFQQLDTWYLKFCGVATILILSSLAFLSMRAIKKMGSVDIASSNFKQTLVAWSEGKLQFLFVQKMSFWLGALLMLVSFPVAVKLFAAVDPFKALKLWMWYAVAFPFYWIFAKKVYRYYSKTTVQMENLLRELEE